MRKGPLPLPTKQFRMLDGSINRSCLHPVVAQRLCPVESEAAMKIRRTKVQMRVGLLMAFTLGMMGSVGLASGISGASSANPFSGKTPAQVLAMSRVAALAEGSVHVVENNTFDGMPGHVVTSAGTTQGRQVLTGPYTGNATILLASARVLYVRGNVTFLGGYRMTQEEATKYADKWIAIPSSSPYFAGTASFLTVSSVMTGVTPSAPLGFTKPKTFAGKRVVGISGGPGPYTPSGSIGTQVLYISTAKPYLPVALVAHITLSAGALSFTDTFSRYGARVAVKAPANSIPISSILAPTP